MIETLSEISKQRNLEDLNERLNFNPKEKSSKPSIYKYTWIEERQKKEIKFLLEENNKLWAEC